MAIENSSESNLKSLCMKWVRVSTAVFTALIIFLLPLKFGNVLYPGTVGLFPLSVLEWVVMQWPPSLFPLFSGLSLFAVILTHPLPSQSNRGWLLPAAWLAPLILSLPALWITTEIGRATSFMWNLLATATLSASVLIIIMNYKNFIGWVLLAVVAGAVLTSADAWYEVVGGGMEDTLRYLQEQGQAHSAEIPSKVKQRLLDGRASGLFVYPNSLAAYLIMVIPICTLAAWRAGKNFEPVLISRFFLAGAFLAVTIPALVWSESRAGFLALGGGLVIAFLLSSVSYKKKILAVIAVLVLTGSAFYFINQGRSTASAYARFGYWRAAVEMFLEHPVTGTGTGEFYPHYMKLMRPGDEPTRVPHNTFLLFAAEAGVIGCIGGVVLLSLPLWFSKLSRNMKNKDPSFLFAIRIGLLAFIIHSLADFNLHIPALTATCAVLSTIIAGLAAKNSCDELESTRTSSSWLAKISLTLLAVVCIAGGSNLPGRYTYQLLLKTTSQPNPDIVKAQKIYAKASQQLPHSPYPAIVFTRAAEKAGAYTLAEEALTEAVARAAHRGSLWQKLAELRHKLDMENKAEAAAEQAAKWLPEHKQ